MQPIQISAACHADYLMLLELGARELATELHEHGWRPSLQEVLLLAEQLASALAHVHFKSILHRDINPSNILLGKVPPHTQRLPIRSTKMHGTPTAGMQSQSDELGRQCNDWSVRNTLHSGASRSYANHVGIDPQAVVRHADATGAVKLTDFSIAELAAELAEEQADRRSLLKGKQPTGGFHKRHLVGALIHKTCKTPCASNPLARSLNLCLPLQQPFCLLGLQNLELATSMQDCKFA